MVEQVNPPFDGSAPCPVCSQLVRGCSAYVHNMLNRWREGDILPEPKFWQKLDDLKMAASGAPGYADPRKPTQRLDTVQSSHPDVKAHLDAITSLVKEYVKHARPTNHVTATEVFAHIKPFVEEVRKTKGPMDKLVAAHFDDERHATGNENVIREQRGYSPDHGGHYDWFVNKVPAAEGDIVHKVCNTGLQLHSRFRERLAKDSKFYGKVWCPTCVGNMPFEQFTVK